MTKYETVEGTEPTTYGQHEPRTIKKHTEPDRFHDDHDLTMMTEIGDGVFVAWTDCRRCNTRVYDCKCTEGPQEPPYMKKWRDERFAKSLNTRPDPDYPLLDSVLEWVRERGYVVTKDEPVEKKNESGDSDGDSEAQAIVQDLARQSEHYEKTDRTKPAGPDLLCDDPDPEHVCDEGECCECGGDHCCGYSTCPVQVEMSAEDWPGEVRLEGVVPPRRSATHMSGRPIEDTELPEKVAQGLDDALKRVQEERDLSEIDVEF